MSIFKDIGTWFATLARTILGEASKSAFQECLDNIQALAGVEAVKMDATRLVASIDQKIDAVQRDRDTIQFGRHRFKADELRTFFDALDGRTNQGTPQGEYGGLIVGNEGYEVSVRSEALSRE